MPNQMTIVEPTLGLQFDIWRENVKGHVEVVQDIFPFAPDGRPVARKLVNKETKKPPVSTKGTTSYMYLAEDGGEGNAYAENEVVWKNVKGEVKKKPTMTTIFTISAYRPIKNYLDNFIIEYFQEVWAYDGDEKAKPEDKVRLSVINNVGLYKLVMKLQAENLVAGGLFNPSSNGSKAGMAWLRPIYEKVNNKIHWGLELASFKEEKVFLHIQEDLPKDPATIPSSNELESRLLI